MKAQFLYQGRKPDVQELEEYFSILEPTYKRLTRRLRVSKDPQYNINTLDWSWFRTLFDDGYAIRCIITREGALKTAGVRGHNGFYNLDTDGVHDFYVTDIKKQYRKATQNGFKTALAYMVVHEYMHGVVWQQTGDRLRAVKDVHDWVDAGTLKQHFEAHMASLTTAPVTPSRKDLKTKLEAIKATLLSLVKPPEVLLHPVPAPRRVTQPYGIASSRYKLTGRHIGTDYGIPVGTPLVAPADGTVTQSGQHAALGFFLHYQYTFKGVTYTERWAHLVELPPKGRFKRGDVIARSGNTGMSTGPHLHREVWYNDVQIGRINSTNWNQLTLDPEKLS